MVSRWMPRQSGIIWRMVILCDTFFCFSDISWTSPGICELSLVRSTEYFYRWIFSWFSLKNLQRFVLPAFLVICFYPVSKSCVDEFGQSFDGASESVDVIFGGNDTVKLKWKKLNDARRYLQLISRFTKKAWPEQNVWLEMYVHWMTAVKTRRCRYCFLCKFQLGYVQYYGKLGLPGYRLRVNLVGVDSSTEWKSWCDRTK